MRRKFFAAFFLSFSSLSSSPSPFSLIFPLSSPIFSLQHSPFNILPSTFSLQRSPFNILPSTSLQHSPFHILRFLSFQIFPHILPLGTLSLPPHILFTPLLGWSPGMVAGSVPFYITPFDLPFLTLPLHVRRRSTVKGGTGWWRTRVREQCINQTPERLPESAGTIDP